jgi:carotenoid cleavage dioxygenase
MTEFHDSELPFYLRDVHAPVTEELEAFDLPIEGALPPELDGLFLRNGPNPLRGDPGHWFLGDGMLHGVDLSGGRANWYRNRFVQTRALRGEARYIDEEGHVDFHAGLANTHVIEHADRILALVENGLPWEVDRQLGTVGVYDFGGKLDGPMTAHPKICPKTGEMHFFGYHFAPPYLVYHRADARGRLVESRPIEIPRPVMMHDFAITENHVIFMDLPVVFCPESIEKGGMPYQWDDDAGARLGFLRRGTAGADSQGAVTWLEIAPGFIFHPMNAYSEGDRITLDAARYDELWRQDSNRFGIARLHRYEIDLGEKRVREERLDDLGVEFPRVPESLTGRRHRIGYGVWSHGDVGSDGRGLVRYDLENGARDLYDGSGQHVPSEALFVPGSGAAGEGDGWLMAYFYDRARGTSFLSVFDASRLSNGPVARVELPARVPLGFHGSWIPRG